MALECVRVSTDATPKGKLLARRRVLDVERAFRPFQLLPSWTCWTVWKFNLWDIRHPLEVVMTTVAEVDGSETEEDSDRATEVTLVLEEVEAVLWTDLSTRDV